MKTLFRYPLQRRILILVSCLVFLPYLAMSYFVSAYYKSYNEDKKTQQYSSLLHIAELMINDHFGQIERRVESLAVSESVKKALNGKNKNEMALTLLFDVPDDLAVGVAALREYHAEICLITSNEDSYERYNQFYHQSRFAQDEEFMAFVESSQFKTWLSPRTSQGEARLYTSTDSLMLPFCHKVMNLSKTVGTLMCCVRMDDMFLAPLQELSQYGQVQILRDGVCIYQINSGEADVSASQGAEATREFTVVSGQFPYQISLHVPVSEFRSPGGFWSILLLLCPLYILLMVLIVSIINTLLKKLNFVSELLLVIDPNQDDQCIPNLGDNEINALGDSINKLLNKVQGQRHELIKSENDRKLAERYALQLQMNPHLLFNALHWLELNLTDDSRDVRTGLLLLGEIYRYNLTEEDRVTVEDELRNAATYVQMMQLLKNSQILLHMDCPSELAECRILRFLLQPVVENAIKHGLQKDVPIRIEIRLFTDGRKLTIQVTNDGVPIPTEKLDRLNRALSQDTKREAGSGHIGLLNLAQRLRITYGEAGRLKLDCKDGLTAVTVEIPYEEPSL